MFCVYIFASWLAECFHRRYYVYFSSAIKIQYNHDIRVCFSGSSKHNITVTGQDGNEPTLKDLSETLTQTTGVPQASQKIIFKGNDNNN